MMSSGTSNNGKLVKASEGPAGTLRADTKAGPDPLPLPLPPTSTAHLAQNAATPVNHSSPGKQAALVKTGDEPVGPLGAGSVGEAGEADIILFESSNDVRQKLEAGMSCLPGGGKYLTVKVFVLPGAVVVVDSLSAKPGQDLIPMLVENVMNDTHGVDITQTLEIVPANAGNKVRLVSGDKSLYLKFGGESEAKAFLTAVSLDKESLHLPAADSLSENYLRAVERAMWSSFRSDALLRRFYFHAVLRRDGVCRAVLLDTERTVRTLLTRKRLHDCQPETLLHVIRRIALSPTLLVLMSVFNINLEDYRDWAGVEKDLSSEDLLNHFIDNFEGLVSDQGLKLIYALYQLPADLTECSRSKSRLWLESTKFASWYLTELPELRRSKLLVDDFELLSEVINGTPVGIYRLLLKFLKQGKSKAVADTFPLIPVDVIKSDPFCLSQVTGDQEPSRAHFSHILFHNELACEHRHQIEDFMKTQESILTDEFLNELISEGFRRDMPKTVQIVQGIVFNADGAISDDIAYYGNMLAILSGAMIGLLIRQQAASGMGASHELSVTSPVCFKELFDVLLRFESLWSSDSMRYSALSRSVEGLKRSMKMKEGFKQNIIKVYRHSGLSIYSHLRDRVQEVSLLFPADLTTVTPAENVSKRIVIDIITGFFIFALEAREVGSVDKTTDILCHFLQQVGSVFYASIFCANGLLRTRVYELLVEYYHVRPRFQAPIVSGLIMNVSENFQESPLKAMAMSTPNMDHIHSGFTVTTVVCSFAKLSDFDNLDDKVNNIELDSGKDITKANQLYQIMQEVSKPSRLHDEFKDITFATLDECSLHGSMALNVLRTSPRGQEKLAQLLLSYLSSFPPTSWCSLFSGASTIAFFIKYLDRENLEKAYEQFNKHNLGNQFVLQLVASVKQQYLAPLVCADNLSVTDPSAMDNVIAQLSADANSSRKTPDDKFLCQVFAEWMKRTKETVKVAMVPRNTQVLTFLTFVRIFNTVGPSSRRAFLAQVGTGEGKSLIIAMIALYQAKIMGKKVHVLANNVGLLQRDYESFRAFYDAFDVTSAASDLDSDCSIVYCQRENIERYYRAKVQANKSPFVNTALVVDEVDQLIVDEFPYSRYVTTNAEGSAFLCACFDILRVGGASSQAPTTHPNFDETIWNEARDAYTTASQKSEGVGVRGGYQFWKDKKKYCMNDSTSGDLLENTTSLWLEYINFIRLPDHRPVYQCSFYLQCMVFMLQQYEQIIGLSGALGSPVEKVYLDKIYNATCFIVPPFLSTCNDVVKEPPVLIDDCAYIFESRDEQEMDIAARAISLSTAPGAVPVLIIMETDEDVNRLFEFLTWSKAMTPHKLQKLLKVDDGRYMPWTTIVRDATLPLNEAGYRITITNYWGGRGHDYVASDERINDNGGLAVLIAVIPRSYREWVQWVGRTGRNDRRGQYSVILNSTQDLVRANMSSLREFSTGGSQYRKGVIDKLLDLSDENVSEVINSRDKDVQSGIRANRLCDLFYTMGGAEAVLQSKNFPANAKQRILMKFLERGDYSVSAVESAALALGLQL